MLFGLLLVAVVAYGQLIIDEDDPEGQKIIALLVKAIDESQKATFAFKKLISTLGDNNKYTVYIEVTNTATQVL